MYYYIIGKITIIKKEGIVIENNNIGYFIIFPNTADIFKEGQKIKLLTYFYQKDNKTELYGFLNNEMLSFFKELLMIPGIGPKNAIILSNSEFLKETQKAIEENELNYLIKFPGIGKKTAQQILFYLQKKMSNHHNKKNLTLKQKNVKEALIKLGIYKNQIDNIITKINSNQNIENMIREALSLLKK
ncbi:Holliday junction branch migration protein RuvA [Texas Phoenix palm phytoplasma]|uniref:Holliday junction branch migration complex subunit RuvA n=1 Tax=Texas Phoenix palm phytoplasma TaxID=176709 RepID=A0ABS5BI47_9MOLU|nr:Holliday junction branch migration protein RuvA [Texas Phoenix palm phytoplasma]MBP3059256.1 Holliday junction branch migration protein RuvA [Texas Phoenix palm phytoplasma]